MSVLVNNSIEIIENETDCSQKEFIKQINLQLDLQENIFKRKNRLDDKTLVNFKTQLEDSLKLLTKNDYALLMFRNNEVCFFFYFYLIMLFCF